jgi:hypothetical protein
MWIPKASRPAPAASRRAKSGPRSQATGKRKEARHQAIAEMCADILAQGGKEFILENASTYVGRELIERLLRSRTRRQCVKLARLALQLIEAKDKIHQAFGGIIFWLLGLIGVHDLTRLIARKLIENLPVFGPIDAKFIATARALQILGIAICFIDDRDLLQCECLKDLIEAETKSRIKSFLETRWEDWARLIIN